MTEEYPSESAPPLERADSLPSQQGTAEMVREQAAGLSQGTVQAGQHAADTAREQASAVAAEAARQGRDLLGQAQDQLGEQAARGQQRLAATLGSLSDQLGAMADGSPQAGMATDLARQAAARAGDAAQWLSSRQPSQVVDEVQSFARRRPGIFLALAAGAGLIAGRLTRGLTAASRSGREPSPPTAPGAGPETAGPWAEPPAEAAYEAGATSGAAEAVPVPDGGVPAETGVPAADPSLAQLGRTAPADRGDLP